MKILFTHELFLPDCAGGGELSTYEIVKGLNKKNDVTVLTTGNPKITNYKGIKTVRLPVNRYLMNFAFPWIYKYAKNFDVIITNNYNACLPSFIAGKLAKKPVICIVHGMYGNQWIKMRGHVFGFLSKIIEKLQINHEYNKVIFLSNYAKKEGIKQGVKEKITEIINPGIPRSFKKYKVRKKEKFVLFVGRLSKQKGIDDLIKAAKELPEIKFKLVGRGEEEKRLKTIAPENVQFLGYVSDKKLIDMYSRALIFCLPSVGEGFGYVLLEAMASGCSIISTVPLDFEGKRIEIGNYKQLAEGIKYLIENPKKAQNMGKKNRKRAGEYNWGKFVEELIKICEHEKERMKI